MKIVDLSLLCGCCLEKSAVQPKLIYQEKETAIIQLRDGDGEAYSLLLHIRWEQDAPTAEASADTKSGAQG